MREVFQNLISGFLGVKPSDYAYNDDFFTWYDGESIESFIRKIKKIQHILEKLLENPRVEKVTFFHDEMGPPGCLEEYEEVDWRIENFAIEFFNKMKKQAMITPTIMAVFEKQKN